MRRIGYTAVQICAAAVYLVPGAALALTPSFDCERARTEIERMICSDDELAALDIELAKAFANALARAPAYSVSELRDAQKNWRRDLMACSRNSDARACTANAYRARLQEL